MAFTVWLTFLPNWKGMIMLFRLAILMTFFSSAAFADTDVPQSGTNPIVFDQTATTDNLVVLMAAASEHNSGLTLFNSGPSAYPKHFWFDNWTHGSNDYMKWNVALATGAVYHVYAKLSASANIPISLAITGTNTVLNFTTRNIGWDKLDCGAISIPGGTNQLVLQSTNKANTISIISLELIRQSDLVAYQQRVASFRSDTTWLSQSKYGLMTQFGAWGFPPSGPQPSLQDFANGFSVSNFVNLVTNTGSKYVIFSLTWYTYQMLAPIQSVDNIVPGDTNLTSTRDVIGELATALHSAGVRFMLYYHTGQDSQWGYDSTPWWQAQQWPEPDHTDRGTGDRSVFFTNWCNVITEIGSRYGTNLDGWFFDDGLVYYPAPFERLGQAAMAGNPNRLVSYNPWIATSYTDFEDVWMGEGSYGQSQFGSTPAGGNGVFTDGPHVGTLQHGMFTMEQDWGIHQQNQPITTQISASQAISWVQSASVRGVPLSFDMMLWSDGTYSATSLAVMESLKNAIYGNSIVNGDFEAPIATGGYIHYPAGSTALTGWTVDAAPSDGVQLLAAGAGGTAVNGSQIVQMADGTVNSVGGGISQTIATTPGRTYTVSIDVAAHSAAPATGNFNFGGSNHVLTATSLSTFTTLTWQVSATSSNTVINITGDPNSASEQLLIDNVQVYPLVAPTVTTQPHSLTNSTGTTATFSVWAVGTAPLSYQWYFNTNTPLTAGTNSVLTLNNVQGSDGGTYSVIVTNAGGAVTSSVAMLTVLPNLTVNGDFEAPTTTGFTRFAAGSTALTGWTVDAAPSDGVQLGTAGEFGAVNGSQNVQLTGGQNYSVGGGISQTIATTPGRTYTVSIDVAARSAAPVMGNFNFGGSNHVLTATSLSTFTTLTWQVSATSSNTVINITGDPNSASEQLIIGNVVVAELDLFTQLPNGN